MTTRDLNEPFRLGDPVRIVQVPLNRGQDVRRRALCEKICNRSISIMTESQAVSFGQMIMARRHELKLERTVAARRSGMNASILYRIEHGQNLSPEPAKLELLARTLKLRLTDVLTAAGYPATRALPEPGPYLRAKYRNLSSEELAALSQEVEAVLNRHGITGSDRPRAGEDETEEADRPDGGRS